jgi:hypothetical protein
MFAKTAWPARCLLLQPDKVGQPFPEPFVERDQQLLYLVGQGKNIRIFN